MLADALCPFIPDAASRITEQLTPIDGILLAGRPHFPREMSPSRRPVA
ncbi:hypothetical protein PYK79_51140 [Streptomyces sp. ID05-04B]|nr:hypothetical protein [Streptomyces sp. ID05-04B]